MTENSRRVVAHPANDRDGMTQTNDISGKRPGRKREIPPCPIESILISATHGRIENAPPHVRTAQSGSWRRVGSDSVPPRPCFSSDDREISRLQTASSKRGKRPHRHRAIQFMNPRSAAIRLAVHFEIDRYVDFLSGGFHWKSPFGNPGSHGTSEYRVSA